MFNWSQIQAMGQRPTAFPGQGAPGGFPGQGMPQRPMGFPGQGAPVMGAFPGQGAPVQGGFPGAVRPQAPMQPQPMGMPNGRRPVAP